MIIVTVARTIWMMMNRMILMMCMVLMLRLNTKCGVVFMNWGGSGVEDISYRAGYC